MGTFPFRREEYAPDVYLSIIKLRKVMICSAVRLYFSLKRKMNVPILGPALWSRSVLEPLAPQNDRISQLVTLRPAYNRKKLAQSG